MSLCSELIAKTIISYVYITIAVYTSKKVYPEFLTSTF